MTDFQLIADFVEASNATNSNSDKLEVIKEYTQYDIVCKALNYTYDTFKQYGVTSANCKKNSDLVSPYHQFEDFFLLLDYLNDRTLTGHDAIKSVNRYVSDNPLYADLIWNIIDRNLKTRSTASMINKVKPGLIPTFDVALAQAYDEKTKKKVDWNDGWYASRKLEKPFYYIFDLLTSKDFADKESITTLSERLETARAYVMNDDYIGVLKQILADDMVMETMMEKSKREGWEGLMLRKDTTYKGKRSNDVLKVKKFFDDEYVVVDLENDTHRVIVDGTEVEEVMLKNVIIEHKGNRVQVGSGFNHEQRRYYFQNPNQILGKQITVQYFEETTNMNGTHSLRFPVIKAVYETPRDI